MPFSIRLDPETEARIRQVASATGHSKSAVVREAVAQYTTDADRQTAPGLTALDRLRGYIGTLTSVGAQLSRDTHEKYRAALLEEPRDPSPRRRRRPHRPAR